MCDFSFHDLSVLLDSGLEGGGVGADDLADLLAVLVEEEGGHGAHALALGDLGDLVDVELEEAGVLVVVGHPMVDLSARCTSVMTCGYMQLCCCHMVPFLLLLLSRLLSLFFFHPKFEVNL